MCVERTESRKWHEADRRVDTRHQTARAVCCRVCDSTESGQQSASQTERLPLKKKEDKKQGETFGEKSGTGAKLSSLAK